MTHQNKKPGNSGRINKSKKQREVELRDIVSKALINDSVPFVNKKKVMALLGKSKK